MSENAFSRLKIFPWFRDATIGELADVRRPSPHHLYWPQLDVDRAVESLDHPEKYPLISRQEHRKLENRLDKKKATKKATRQKI